MTWHDGEVLTTDDLLFTLQVGREPMNERVAVIAADFGELSAKLTQFLQGHKNDCIRGSAAENKAALNLLRQVHEDDQFLDPFLKERQLVKSPEKRR